MAGYQKVVGRSAVGAGMLLLAACADPVLVDEHGRSDVLVSRAAPPSAVVRYPQADAVLSCIRDTGRLRNPALFAGGVCAAASGA